MSACRSGTGSTGALRRPPTSELETDTRYHATPFETLRLVARSATSSRAAYAASWPAPPSATSAAVTKAASSIVAWSRSVSHRASQRAETRAWRRGSFTAIRAVSCRASTSVTRPSSRSVFSATSRLPRSTARWKVDLGWPCSVVRASPGPGGRQTLAAIAGRQGFTLAGNRSGAGTRLARAEERGEAGREGGNRECKGEAQHGAVIGPNRRRLDGFRTVACRAKENVASWRPRRRLLGARR